MVPLTRNRARKPPWAAAGFGISAKVHAPATGGRINSAENETRIVQLESEGDL